MPGEENSSSGSNTIVALLDKFLTPTAWIAGILALIGLAGLAFNAFLSLLVGAQVANYSSTAEHFGAGASLLFPGLVYTIDLIAAALYLIFVLVLAWVLFVFVLRLSFLAAYGLLLLVAWAIRRGEKKGLRARVASADVEGAADKLTNGSPLVLHWSQNMHVTVRRAVSWTVGRFTWVFTFTFVVVAAIFLTLWIPYTEANRFRAELGRAAELSLTCQGQIKEGRCIALMESSGTGKVESAADVGAGNASATAQTAAADSEAPPSALNTEPASANASNENAEAQITPVGEPQHASLGSLETSAAVVGNTTFCWPAAIGGGGNGSVAETANQAHSGSTDESPPAESDKMTRDASQKLPPAPENRKFTTPVLTYLADKPVELLGRDSAAAEAFSWGARYVSCGVNFLQARIPLDALLARPKLVAVGYGAGNSDVVLRPMLTVAEYGDAVVLYDFLFDAKFDDPYLYPLRVLKQSSVKTVTAIDPAGRVTEGGFPILSVLTAACGIDPLAVDPFDPPEIKEVRQKISSECTGTSVAVQTCIKNEFVNIDTLSCRPRRLPRPPTPPTPPINDSSALMEIGKSLAEIKERLGQDSPVALASRLEEINRDIAMISDRLDRARLVEFIPALDRVGANVSNLDADMDSLDADMEKHDTELAKLSPSLVRIESQILDLDADLAGHDTRLKDLDLGSLGPAIAAVSGDIVDARNDFERTMSEGKAEIMVALIAIRSDLNSLAETIAEVAEANAHVPQIALDVKQVLGDVDVLERKLAEAHDILKMSVEKGINVRLFGETSRTADGPGVTRPPFSDIQNYFAPPESLVVTDTRRCTKLPRWNEAAYAIEFENDEHRVDSPRRHDLVSTDGSDPWVRLMQVFADWSGVVESTTLGSAGSSVFVMLTGRASENGDFGHNLDLSRDRAAAVERALQEFWAENGAEPYHVIAVGRGEFDRQTGAEEIFDSPTEARRVDAAVCLETESASSQP